MGLKVRSVPRTLRDARLWSQKLQREKLLIHLRKNLVGCVADMLARRRVLQSWARFDDPRSRKKLLPHDGAANE